MCVQYIGLILYTMETFQLNIKLGCITENVKPAYHYGSAGNLRTFKAVLNYAQDKGQQTLSMPLQAQTSTPTIVHMPVSSAG